MLKAQLHIHAKGDPLDTFLKYTPKDVIDKASKLKFDVLAFTFHTKVFYNKEIEDYAKSKNILLIPGIEIIVEGKHVLILGLKKLPEINSLKDLKKIKNNALIIAPHPFFPRFYSLNNKLLKNINLFHGVEYSFFYRNKIDFNKKAIKTAEQYNKPLIGTSDLHGLRYINDTYTLIDAKKNIKDILEAIKNNKIKIVTNPMSIKKFYLIPLYLYIKKKIAQIFS